MTTPARHLVFLLCLLWLPYVALAQHRERFTSTDSNSDLPGPPRETSSLQNVVAMVQHKTGLNDQQTHLFLDAVQTFMGDLQTEITWLGEANLLDWKPEVNRIHHTYFEPGAVIQFISATSGITSEYSAYRGLVKLATSTRYDTVYVRFEDALTLNSLRALPRGGFEVVISNWQLFAGINGHSDYADYTEKIYDLSIKIMPEGPPSVRVHAIQVSNVRRATVLEIKQRILTSR